MIGLRRLRLGLTWLRSWCLWFGRCSPTTVLIRHADIDQGSGTDPPLNTAGLARAQELHHALRDAGIGAIFVTHFRRSQQTAEPLAADLGLVPAVVDDVDLTVSSIRILSRSSVALVVGHTNTLPAISSGLGGPAIPAIGATEFDHLFVLARARLAHLRYGA